MDSENTARDLGRMEGKLDLLLQMHQQERDAATASRKDVDARLTALETWKTKATTLYSGALAVLTAIWSAVTFYLK